MLRVAVYLRSLSCATLRLFRLYCSYCWRPTLIQVVGVRRALVHDGVFVAGIHLSLLLFSVLLPLLLLLGAAKGGGGTSGGGGVDGKASASYLGTDDGASEVALW